MNFLHFLWDREILTLKTCLLQQRRKKSSLDLAIKLETIPEGAKSAILKEYFNMYKMLYRIRSTVAYYWDCGERSSSMIKELYSQDKTFLKMIRIV